MQEPIRVWLSERGMAQYAEAFAAQNVDLAILPNLTDQDLKDLGVLLGDRRKILAWAEELKEASALSRTANIELAPHTPEEAERRQVTVLFCDLVDSTGLARRLDPEDLRGVIRAYQDAVTKAVRKYDGFVAGFRGDGVLVYFGYPNAHEDDAERAVRAALELVPAISAIRAIVPLSTRVGISTGLVVVGDLIGSGDTQERNMVGDTPNLAARLLALAEPDSVVLSEESRGMLGGFFELEDLGTRPLKGIEQPVRAWSVLRSKPVESRFDALHGAALTELSGRDDELQLLLKRWQKAKSGEGQVVVLSGEPGIGKSRLTAALMEAIEQEPHTKLRYFCSPQHTDSAFYPVINHLERLAGFAHGDSADIKLDKLDKMLTSVAATAHDKSLIAALLSLPTDLYPALDYDAAQRRAKTMDALHAQLVAVTKRGPVLQISEDAHWTDPTSLEATGRSVERIKNLPILHIITYRPEFAAPWIGESHVTSINLNRLGNREASRIVASLAGNKAISPETIADIVDRSDGIPLFLEEMTKAVLEAESEGEARRAIKAVPSQKSAVPASLHASLMARLDRLGAAKGIAQVGAAIGRSFSHQLLAAVTRESEAELAALLDRLIASGLLFRQGQPPDATYLFKHALIRDAAYSMLLRESRRALHARILEALETKFADVAANQPELLAHHAEEAGEIEKAVQLWGEAGMGSFSRSALAEAVAQLTQAQDLLERLPSTQERRRRQINLQMPLSQAVMHTKGYSAPETEAATKKTIALIEQARAVGEAPEIPLLEFVSLWILWGVKVCVSDAVEERKLANHCLRLAEVHQDIVEIMLGNIIVGISLFFSGDLVRARRHFDKAISLYEPEKHRALAYHLPQDIRVYALSYRCWTLPKLGYLDAALRDVDALLRDAREIGHPATLMFGLHSAVYEHICYGDLAIAEQLNHECLAMAEDKHAAFFQANSTLALGGIYAETDRPEEAVQLLKTGIGAWTAMGATIASPSHQSSLAKAYALLGQFDEAWEAIGKAVAFFESVGPSCYETQVYQIAGEIALMMPHPDVGRAEGFFKKGLSIARSREVKAWELHITTCLARLWRDQGKSHEAFDLLAPIYNWFTEGFSWRRMIEAKALLEELRAELRLD